MMNEHKTLLHNVDKLLNMLVHLFIIRPYKSDKTHIKYILPCLLPDRTEYDLKRMNESVKTKRFQIVFPDNHMPPTFYYVLVGGLLKEWKLIEKNPDMPEIYNLYACFRLDSETQQLEIFWKESQVYINLKNYSRDKEWERNKIVEILEIVKKRIQKVFLVYRHTNEDYEIRVQCPEHKTSFVSLAAIMRDGEAMCNDDTLKHGLTYEDVFHSKLLETNPLLKEKPTDKHLGRLAIYLVREEAISLAARLRLHLSLIEVDRAAQKTSDTNMRRLYILYKWRSSNGFATLGDLIELLTVTKDYHTDELLKQLETSPERQKYAIPSKRLDCIPENNVDIKIASKYIGALFQFLMLELGLHVVEIEADIANNRGDMYNTIFCLLDKWRKKHAENSTTRTLLDTASFVGIDTIEMQKEIIKKSQQLRY
ncbi:uncharacterized protein LOC128546531 [Mercenaria mercenaria]|uniref:uncharacterized protein LOC128546531 n=1 Tax=Mercenaria mercenaria TaxID=6596 RepID=UPI00234E76EF|nr:uncharacterized protein LOC128546531 [Mercenaria mercenaria]